MTDNKNFKNEFDEQFADSYREGKSSATNSDHQLPGNSVSDSGKSLTTAISEAAKDLAEQVKPKDLDKFEVFGHDIKDYVNSMLPNGAPEGSRHKFALKLFYDILILSDGDHDRARKALLQITWVQDIVTERGMAEIDRIVESGRKLLHKKESESFNDPQPSKEMRRAIEQVTTRKYSILVREQRAQSLGLAVAMQEDILHTLNRIGLEIEKLFPQYQLLKLLCHRQKRKHYIAALFLGGAYAMTLCTRMYFKFWPSPGRKCRMNCIVMLIGRSGSGKHMGVDLYEAMMAPIKAADAAQIAALNQWNEEKEQKSGGEKNKTPRPKGSYRCLPPESSAAAIREAEFNAKEIIDNEEISTHVFLFNSELDDQLRQMKKSHMEQIMTLWLRGFSNEPQGTFLKTTSSQVGEYNVHFNCCYTGTDDAARKLLIESYYVNGLLFRISMVPMGDTNYEMKEKHDYEEKDEERDKKLREWAYKLNSTKGEIPCKEISDALYNWTARRMDDAREDDSKAAEDILKRCCWVGVYNALPFIVSRHWDQMVKDGEYYKCGPDFKIDKTDVKLALLITSAQHAFQEYYLKAIGEKYYDNLATEQASNVRHQQKTLLAFRRLPTVFGSVDVDREYNYGGNKNSINSRLKRLQDDGLIKKIRSGEDKGKYCKLA